jgi:hypothetical protein
MEFLIGTGLGVVAVGIALFVGLPPPWWSQMPKHLVRFGVHLGVFVFFFGVWLILVGACQGWEVPYCKQPLAICDRLRQPSTLSAFLALGLILTIISSGSRKLWYGLLIDVGICLIVGGIILNYSEASGPAEGSRNNGKFRFELFDKEGFRRDDKASYREIFLRVASTSETELTNIKLIMTRAEGPKDFEYFATPITMDFPSKLNPMFYVDIALAYYVEKPPTSYMGYNLGGQDIGYYSFKATTPCEYTFFITAAESLPSKVTVKISVDAAGVLRYRRL